MAGKNLRRESSGKPSYPSVHPTSTKHFLHGFPGGSVAKKPPANAGDTGWILGSGRSPGGGYGSPLQYSCLENFMGRRTWWATIRGVTKSQTQLSVCTHTHIYICHKSFGTDTNTNPFRVKETKAQKKNNLPQQTELIIGQTKIYQSLRYVAFYEIEKKI